MVLTSVFQTGQIYKAFYHNLLEVVDGAATGKIEPKDYIGSLAPDEGGAIRADILAKVKDEKGDYFNVGNHCTFRIKQHDDGFLKITVRLKE